MSHHHIFEDYGIYVNYCTKLVNNKICPIAQDKKTGKIGEFILWHGQGIVPDSSITKYRESCVK